MEKRCCICKKVLKAPDNFYKNKSKSDGLCSFCKECSKEKNQKRQQTKKWKEYKRNYNKLPEVQKHRREMSKIISHFPKTKYSNYKWGAIQRNLVFNLSFAEFMEFWQKPCYYCGNKIETIGLDRADNKKGYNKNNIVSCCIICNGMKGTLSQDEFIKHCKIISKPL